MPFRRAAAINPDAAFGSMTLISVSPACTMPEEATAWDHSLCDSLVTCIVFSDTHARDLDALECIQRRPRGRYALPNPAAKHADEFRRETADHIISTGRPITECCAELGLNSKTVNKWVQNRRRELAGGPDPKAEDRELREAKRRIRELEMENAF